ncbi:MAG: ROK family protein [Salinivirgaceae bacterium]|nr:ROK family protein [Salinivirgaceae bacterium]
MESPIIMTLDAGGTNFVFNAIQNANEILEPINFQSNAHDLDLCLKTIIQGFDTISKQLPQKPVAISFAFPGPADYKNGIIGDLGNLPAFRGGVALGAMLEEYFQIPVFINNDGDLFAYGESKFGMLPEINNRLKTKGSSKQFNNLFGVTLGTGFGGGLVNNGKLYLGDNGAGAEVWLMRNPLNNNSFVEENISVRAIVREYQVASNSNGADITPFQIFNIGLGKLAGNKDAALLSFKKFGHALGQVLAEIVTITDSPIVIGGGLSDAYTLFAPEMLLQLNGKISDLNGNAINRLELQVFDADNDRSFETFVQGELTQVKIPFSLKTVNYDPLKSICVGKTRLGTSKAIALGAYAYAMDKLKLNC